MDRANGLGDLMFSHSRSVAKANGVVSSARRAGRSGALWSHLLGRLRAFCGY